MNGPDVGEVQRLVVALGLAAARSDTASMADVLAGVDPDTAGSVVLGLAHAWVGALDAVMERDGEQDPRAVTLALLQEQALEVATV
ncbi:hypothetical protein [Streptomyces phaeoluteigriseus]|uniref:hypothetical protein n=1 Tax=Streptomyces phaeoluteigriseus TaxID=114686 RepID=UPI003677CD68